MPPLAPSASPFLIDNSYSLVGCILAQRVRPCIADKQTFSYKNSKNACQCVPHTDAAPSPSYRGQAGCSPRRHAARRARCTARPHRHNNTTHVTQIRVHLKASPPPHPTRPPLARAASPRVPRRRRARRRKQQGRRKSTSGLSCPRPRSRSSAACAPAPCRPPSARPART